MVAVTTLALYTECVRELRARVGGGQGRDSRNFRLLNAASAGHPATQYKQPGREEGPDSCSHQCKHNINIDDSRKQVKSPVSPQSV